FAAKRLRKGKVLAFEPMETMFQYLKRNVDINGCSNVLLYEIGLGSKSELADLFTAAPDSDSQDHLNEGLPSMFRSSSRPCRIGTGEIRTFDEIFKETQLERLDIIKIDVEGAELPVLRGALGSIRRYRPLIIVEICEANFATAGYTSADVLSFVQTHGYEF